MSVSSVCLSLVCCCVSLALSEAANSECQYWQSNQNTKITYQCIKLWKWYPTTPDPYIPCPYIKISPNSVQETVQISSISILGLLSLDLPTSPQAEWLQKKSFPGSRRISVDSRIQETLVFHLQSCRSGDLFFRLRLNQVIGGHTCLELHPIIETFQCRYNIHTYKLFRTIEYLKWKLQNQLEHPWSCAMIAIHFRPTLKKGWDILRFKYI